MPKRKRRGRKLSKEEARAFLATERGQRWLAKRILEERAGRPDPGPTPERLTRTKFPFRATINGKKGTFHKTWGVVAFVPDEER